MESKSGTKEASQEKLDGAILTHQLVASADVRNMSKIYLPTMAFLGLLEEDDLLTYAAL